MSWELNTTVTLHTRRCHACKTWSCTESDRFPCGACAMGRIADLEDRIACLRKSNAALRGALKRKRGRK